MTSYEKYRERYERYRKIKGIVVAVMCGLMMIGLIVFLILIGVGVL